MANLGELSALATLNNQPYLNGLKKMGQETKAQTASIAASFNSIRSSFTAFAGAAGFGGLGAAVGLSIPAAVEAGKNALTRFAHWLADYRPLSEAMQRDIAETNRRFVAFQQARQQLQERLGTQVRQLGMTPAQRDADNLRQTGHVSEARREWIEEQHRIIDGFRAFRDEVQRATQRIAELQNPLQSFTQRLADLMERPAANAQNPWLPVPDATDEQRARGVARLFQGLPGFGEASLPRALERGSVDAITAINSAASQRGNTVADLIARVEEQLQLDREQVALGRELLAAIEQNPRLRTILGR